MRQIAKTQHTLMYADGTYPRYKGNISGGRLSSDARRGIVSVGYDNDGHPVRTVFKDGNEQRDVWDGFGNHLATHYYSRAGASKEAT
ncbi:MAG: hypothetical protein K2G00_06845 [Duncaniella sp.]|nr:hypothetical protein [Duncaniella sp.]